MAGAEASEKKSGGAVAKAQATPSKKQQQPAKKRLQFKFEPYPISYKIFRSSPEVWLSGMAVLLSLFFVLLHAGDTALFAPGGLWRPDDGQSVGRWLQRGAKPTHTLNADIVLMIAAVMSVLSLLQACGRVLLKEKLRMDSESAKAERDRLRREFDLKYNNNNNTSADNDNNSNNKSSSSSSKSASETKGKSQEASSTPNPEGPIIVHFFDEDIITNIMIAVGVVLSIGVAVFVQLQEPNEVRAFGGIGMILVLIGAAVAPRLGVGLISLIHFCGFVKSLLLLALLYTVGRATLGSNTPLFHFEAHSWGMGN